MHWQIIFFYYISNYGCKDSGILYNGCKIFLLSKKYIISTLQQKNIQFIPYVMHIDKPQNTVSAQQKDPPAI